jgi:hypothetical protein
MRDNKSRKTHKLTHLLHNLDSQVFAHPKTILGLILLVTLFFAFQIPGVKIYSDFADLLPQTHSYIELHNEIKESFGGANVIVVGVETEQGDIFTSETLARIHRITQGVDRLPGVNHNLVTSVTHRNTRKVWLTSEGNLNSEPYYNPEHADLESGQLDNLRKEVTADPRVYGPLVSPDMRMALVKAQLNEGKLDYIKTFEQIQQLRAEEAASGIRIHVTGQPMLVGWAYQYMGQIIQIFMFTALIMVALLAPPGRLRRLQPAVRRVAQRLAMGQQRRHQLLQRWRRGGIPSGGQGLRQHLLQLRQQRLRRLARGVLGAAVHGRLGQAREQRGRRRPDALHRRVSTSHVQLRRPLTG